MADGALWQRTLDLLRIRASSSTALWSAGGLQARRQPAGARRQGKRKKVEKETGLSTDVTWVQRILDPCGSLLQASWSTLADSVCTSTVPVKDRRRSFSTRPSVR